MAVDSFVVCADVCVHHTKPSSPPPLLYNQPHSPSPHSHQSSLFTSTSPLKKEAMANHPDQLKTWVLKVYIHCQGCKKKVSKILQSIDGVYKVVIDSQQHKATVTASVTGDTLVQKLLKSGKHAEILPEIFDPEKPKTKKQNNKKKAVDDEDHPEPPFLEELKEAEPKDLAAHDGDTEQKIIVPIVAGDEEHEDQNQNNTPPSGKNKKKKNKKKKKVYNDDDNASPKGETEETKTQTDNNPPSDDESVTTNGDESKERSHFVAPGDQMVYATPPNLPPPAAPYFGYYPVPAYGMSYNTSYPSSEASYYTPPVYGYAQSHPSAAYYNPPPMMPPPAYYGRSAFDNDDDDGEGKGYCTIM